VIGPWPWSILLYVHDDDDVVYVVGAHDGRTSTYAT
jgi:hypothetical protein